MAVPPSVLNAMQTFVQAETAGSSVEVVEVVDAAERDRRAHVQAGRTRALVSYKSITGTAARRSATAKTSKEEMKIRLDQREAATARRWPMLEGEAAEAAMRTKPDRLPPLVLSCPHEAAPPFHDDWTRVPGSHADAAKWEMELRLRDARNRMIHEHLNGGRDVWYKSSGNSMWPLVHSGDACTFKPIQAVTARDGIHATAPKGESDIGMGDIVFCQVQPTNQYYAHIVLDIELDIYAKETKYWIGNIEQRRNGWCFREHIYGILFRVEKVEREGYYARPFPKSVYVQVGSLVYCNRWSRDAARLCEPTWQ